MSLGQSVSRVLYVGRDGDAAQELSTFEGEDRTFLVSMADRASVALDHLTRDQVACVVCENALLAAGHQELLHRVSSLDADLPVVLVTDGGAPAVSPDLYDVRHRRDGGSPADPSLPRLLEELLGEVPDLDRPPEGFAGVDPPRSLEDAGRELAPEELLELTPDNLARIDRDGTLGMVSAGVAERLGIDRADLVGRPLSAVLDTATAAELVETGAEVVASGQRRRSTEEIGGRQYQLTFAPVDDETFELTIRDVTALRRAVRAYREERGFLESVVQGHPDVFVVLDADYDLVRWNDRLNEITGLPDRELATAHATGFLTAPGDTTVADSLDAIVERGRGRVRLDLRRDDGELVPHEFSGGAVRDGGEVRYLCATGRDVSDRLAAERERDELIEELRRSNAELEQFAYVASHDLKEPLRMIASYLELLQRRYTDDLDEDAEEFVAFAVEGAHRMQEMVDDLLEYSRVGRTDDDPEPVDCEAVLERVVHALQVTIEERGATVAVGDLPTVVGDRNRLFQLFQNLLENAIAYNDGEPHVEVSATRDGDEWVFAVRDDGRGIPPDRVDRVFDLFYRSDVQESTGIGLALVKKIAESHGGTVDVTSTEGEGSTFSVRLPAREGATGGSPPAA